MSLETVSFFSSVNGTETATVYISVFCSDEISYYACPGFKSGMLLEFALLKLSLFVYSRFVRGHSHLFVSISLFTFLNPAYKI